GRGARRGGGCAERGRSRRTAGARVPGWSQAGGGGPRLGEGARHPLGPALPRNRALAPPMIAASPSAQTSATQMRPILNGKNSMLDRGISVWNGGKLQRPEPARRAQKVRQDGGRGR